MTETRSNTKSVCYQFGKFQVDPSSFRLSEDGKPVDLEPKALHLLLFFLENGGRLLRKQELLDAVWGDASVTENALTREIAILRRALSDSTKEPRYIETVPTQGYRFVAEITTSDREEELSARTEPGSPSIAAIQPVIPVAKSRTRSLAAAIGLLVVIGATVAYSLRNRDAGKGGIDRPHLRLVQLTFSGGLDGYPSFSSDGRSVVFSSDRTGTFELYVRQIADNGGEIQLTRDSGGNIQAAWSPNGQWVAYHSLQSGGIWVIPALGGTPRRITEFGCEPSWSHDGTRIAFQSGGLGGIMEANSGAMPGSTIWIAQVSNGDVKQLTTLTGADAFYGDGSPRWSADDQRILFENSGRLWTVGVDGTKLKAVNVDRPASDPVLAEDNRSIFFFSQDAEGSGLWKVALDADLEATGPSARMYNSAPGSARYLAAGAGSRFAFSVVSTHDNLYSLPMTSAGTPAVPVALTQDTRLRKTRPLFSPDGSMISFLVGQRGRWGQLWTVRPDGSQPTQIPLSSEAVDPDWCGARALCYWSLEDRPGTRMSRWDLTRGRPELFLLAPGKLSAIRISPDQTTGAFQRIQDGAMSVWSISLHTGKIRLLTSGNGVIGWPAWSRDGSLLAVEIRDGVNTQIGVLPASGGTPTLLTHGPGQSWPFSWSPDGDAILFAGSRSGVWNVYSVSRTSGTIQQLTRYKSQSSFVRYPDWSPNGRQIVYEYGASNANIWVLEPQK